jgi:hypothetical protein
MDWEKANLEDKLRAAQMEGRLNRSWPYEPICCSEPSPKPSSKKRDYGNGDRRPPRAMRAAKSAAVWQVYRQVWRRERSGKKFKEWVREFELTRSVTKDQARSK